MKYLKGFGGFLFALSVPAILICALAFFTIQIYRGEYGRIALEKAEREHASKLQSVERLEQREASLKQRNRAMRPETLNLDLLDERARDVLGMIGRDEVFLVSD